jgi:hypothetical protein
MPDKDKVERPFSDIRQEFFLDRCFRILDDLNAQLADWLATQRLVAKPSPPAAGAAGLARASLRCGAQARAARQP